MNKVILSLSLFILLLLTSCRIGKPPIEESPIFFVIDNSIQEEYLNVDSSLGVKLNIEAGYFIDSSSIFLNLVMEIENFSSEVLFIDNKSMKVTSNNFQYEFIARDPEVSMLYPNEDYDFQYVFKSRHSNPKEFLVMLKEEESYLYSQGSEGGKKNIPLIDSLRFVYFD